MFGRLALATFRRVVVPLAWPGILSGMVLTFAHTVGEFGIVLMIGGNLPETRTLSIQIYDDLQAARLRQGHSNRPGAARFRLRRLVPDVCSAAPGAAVMSAELVAAFTKRFASGVVIEAALQSPTDRFTSTVLFGPSGCGKTTILRCLAGLTKPEQGTIRWSTETWFDAATNIDLPPQRRGIGFLFQDYALFPHLTVANNIAYGLTGLGQSERQRRVAELLDLLQLTGLEGRYPHQLSGGQQQRVALARALAPRPRLLLLDAPPSALDAPTREQLRRELRRLLATVGTPTVIVTHDRVEAMALADRVIVLDRGRIRQNGTVQEVFSRPADLAVAQIVGVETVEPGRVLRVEDGLATVAVGRAELLAVARPTPPATEVYVCIRAEEVVLRRRGQRPTSRPESCGWPCGQPGAGGAVGARRPGLRLRSGCPGDSARVCGVAAVRGRHGSGAAQSAGDPSVAADAHWPKWPARQPINSPSGNSWDPSGL